MEAWQKVLVDAGAISSGVHAYIACTQCHGGSNTGDFARAHEGLIADPSEAPRRACGDCHVDTQAAHDGSLHVTLAGYDTALHARSVPENHPALDEMQSYHCESCHASCGQCHISQPTSVGGGLLEGHAVVTTPPMSRTCIGCHGSRVGFEYTGRNEGYPADVHLSSGRMTCADCHSGDEMHGVGVEGAHRYEGVRLPTCESCHAEALATADIEQHTIHGQDVACEVCHSVAYKNCSGCHVERTEDDTPFFRTEASWMDFRIGLNPTRTPERPWQYVLVRHVPISPTSFDFYGLGLLPNFDLRPTWLYTTPHNIQRNTPQTETCASCHGNPDIFLTSRDVLPEELEANAAIVIDIPPSLDLLNR